MIDRRLVKAFDWGLLGLSLVIAAIGAASVYSAAAASGNSRLLPPVFVKQIAWYSVGLFAMILSFSFHYRHINRWAYLIYSACIILLVATILLGRQVAGAKRWIFLGPFSFQTSEMMKLGLIFALARYYSRSANIDGFGIRDLLRPFILVMIPFALVAKQPDLGTAMVLLLIAGSMTLFCKVKRATFIGLAVTGLVSTPLIWHFLKNYQRQRILTFLNPDRDPLGAGYHIIQSKIAIGSGMLTGRGYLKGTQNSLSFLPEQHTDFIFSVIAEEWGFIGACVVLSLFLILMMQGLKAAYNSRDSFGTLLCVGIVSMIFWHVTINIGMVMGLMPVVGVTLPLISYGGSSTIVIMTGIGLLIGVHSRRFIHV